MLLLLLLLWRCHRRASRLSFSDCCHWHCTILHHTAPYCTILYTMLSTTSSHLQWPQRCHRRVGLAVHWRRQETFAGIDQDHERCRVRISSQELSLWRHAISARATKKLLVKNMKDAGYRIYVIHAIYRHSHVTLFIDTLTLHAHCWWDRTILAAYLYHQIFKSHSTSCPHTAPYCTTLHHTMTSV